MVLRGNKGDRKICWGIGDEIGVDFWSNIL